MHTVHFAAEGSALVTPLCGDWGSMDTEWTAEPARVTCPACRSGLQAGGRPAGSPAPARARP